MTEKMKKEAEAEKIRKQAEDAEKQLNNGLPITPWQTE